MQLMFSRKKQCKDHLVKRFSLSIALTKRGLKIMASFFRDKFTIQFGTRLFYVSTNYWSMSITATTQPSTIDSHVQNICIFFFWLHWIKLSNFQYLWNLTAKSKSMASCYKTNFKLNGLYCMKCIDMKTSILH